MNIFTRWLVNAAGLFVVTKIVPGVKVDDLGTLLIAAAGLGLVNAVIRPVLIILTLPINILSLGVFTLLINGALFYLVSRIVAGFYVRDFAGAFWGALCLSFVSFLLSAFMGQKNGPQIRTRIFSGNAAPRGRPAVRRHGAIDVESRDPDKSK